jgi:CO/xanthine dehydrogenase Mo-binding subunit
MEPLALALSKKAGGRPVKLVMSRSEVLRATGPTASASMDVKLGMKRDGTITAGQVFFRMQGGAFVGMSPIGEALPCAFACYDIPALKHEGVEVIANRPKAAAYRAPGSPMAAFAVESLVDEMCRELKLDPIEVRLKNGARNGSKSSYGPDYNVIGLQETLEAAKAHPNYKVALGPSQGRGVASGFWFNHGGETSVSLAVGEDGTATVSIGTPDIGGSRASIGLMVAEFLGIPYENVRVNVVETGALGVNERVHRLGFAIARLAHRPHRAQPVPVRGRLDAARRGATERLRSRRRIPPVRHRNVLLAALLARDHVRPALLHALEGGAAARLRDP